MVDSMVDEALDFYVKATGRDGVQKRQELVNMRPGELRRSLKRWQARAKEVQRLQDKTEQAWDLYTREAELQTQEGGLRERPQTQGDAQRQGRREKSARVDRRDAVQGPESRSRTRSSGEKVDGDGRLQFPETPSLGEALGTRRLLLITIPFFVFSDDSTIARRGRVE